MSRGTLLGAALILAACGSVDSAARADDEAQARISAGASLYRHYCISCHGPEARGDGPAGAALRVPPPDLTRIAARREGRFDAGEIAAFIDGRTQVTAHGRRDMPVWGRIYDDRNGSIVTDETLLSPGMIFNIIEYLRSLQVEGDS
jgi:mono/diheme cytochrome c family protein